jgi:phosphate/sulfate permease
MSNIDVVNQAPGGVLTLPVSIALAGGLYWLLRNFL